MRIGLLGGSFNPVHRGHVQIAGTIRDAFLLDEVVIVVSAQPPHKEVSAMAPASDRLEMTRLAFASVPGCRVSDVELRRAGPSYTIDTITFFQSTLPDDRSSLYLIMGVDAFLELNTWKNYPALIQTVPLIIVHRPNAGPDDQQQTMKTFLKAEVSADYVFSKSRSCFYHPDMPSVFFFSQINLFISSTEIRQRIQAGRPVNPLLPDAVARFIHTKGLYL